MASVDRIVKSLERMRVKLLKAAEKSGVNAAKLHDSATELRNKASEHVRSKGRAENIADNLAKLLGS